ncbi:hypothetical protein F2Q69_00014754 [Brassica cretica]|uniref:Uncharacterized protein n=1 Tax=Brassica cretica TaxID=69181 RepID=A0A8S9QWP4_BRACR|nr:hypothetical protein F2Q69_00014754 [Brassica cretica]
MPTCRIDTVKCHTVTVERHTVNTAPSPSTPNWHRHSRTGNDEPNIFPDNSITDDPSIFPDDSVTDEPNIFPDDSVTDDPSIFPDDSVTDELSIFPDDESKVYPRRRTESLSPTTNQEFISDYPTPTTTT